MFGFGSNRNPDETREERRERRREANQEASARYAVQAYRDEGTPIPPHLRDRVDAQIARGDYAPRSADRDSRRGNVLDFFMGPAPGSTASILGTPRPAPTPGPNYYAGLGAPGVARDDTPMLAASSAPVEGAPVAAAPIAAAPVVSAPAGAGPSNVLGNLSGNVAFDPASQFTFEQYLAMLNSAQGFAPPPVMPLAMASSPQGIMSLPAAGLMG